MNDQPALRSTAYPTLCPSHAREAEGLGCELAEIYRHAGAIGPNLSRLDRHDEAERRHKRDVLACPNCQVTR